MNILTRIPVLVLALLFLSLPAAVHAAKLSADDFFNETLGDFQEELEEARDQNKKGILFFFEMDECPFCHRMKEMVLNQSEVQQYFHEHFLVFAVDIEGDVEITDFSGRTMSSREFAEKYNRVRATPVFAFFDLEGKRIARYTGATSTVREFLLLGEFVVDGHYKTSNFSRFKRQQLKKPVHQ